MEKELLIWDIYETSLDEKLHGIKFRGRIRKFGLVNGINVLAENASPKDVGNRVRFAVLNEKDAEKITWFCKSIFPNAEIKLILSKVKNPVLSRLIINKEERYEI